jgi:hypothetical protein
MMLLLLHDHAWHAIKTQAQLQRMRDASHQELYRLPVGMLNAVCIACPGQQEPVNRTLYV